MTGIEAYKRVSALRQTLREIANRDPDQEVQGIALPVIDAVVTAAKQHLDVDDPVVDSLRELISADVIGLGEPMRAVDAWIAIEQLEKALDQFRPRAVIRSF